jgi:hypothetical protein
VGPKLIQVGFQLSVAPPTCATLTTIDIDRPVLARMVNLENAITDRLTGLKSRDKFHEL